MYMQPESKQDRQMQEEALEPTKTNLQRKISDLSEAPQPQLRYTYSGMSNTSSNNQFPLCSNPSSSEEYEKIRFIKDEELFFSIREKLNKMYIEMMIGEDLILYLLYTYKWNEEKLRQKYYDNDSQIFREKHTALTMNKERGHDINGICPVCENNTRLFSNMLCEHFFCLHCWQEYINEKLLEGEIFFPCMNEKKCQKCPVLKSFVDKIAPTLTQLYRKKICMNFAIEDKNITYCPNQRCPFFCEKTMTMEIENVSCPCGTLYCFRCGKEPHTPISCSDVQKWEKMLNNDKNNQSWIKQNTKTCPHCKNQIQKKVGCSKMKCICQCQFCFQCNSLWDEAHSQSGSECAQNSKKQKNKQKELEITKLNNKLTTLMGQAAKNMQTINVCYNSVSDQIVKSRLSETKRFVLEAWLVLKWSLVSIFLKKNKSIEHQFETQYIASINTLMEPIQYISKHPNLPIKQLNHLGEQALMRLECFKKVRSFWLEAYRSIIQL